MSRRETRRGGGAIRGLSAVLVLLVVLVLYEAWANAIPFTDIPFLLLLAPLWFFVVFLILAAAVVGVSLRGRQTRARPVAGAPSTPRDSTSYGTPPEEEATPWESPPPRRDRVVIDFVPVMRAGQKEDPDAAATGVSFIDHAPEAEPTPRPGPTREPVEIPPEVPAIAVVENAPAEVPRGHPETLLSRLLNWIEETSPETASKRRSRGSSSGKPRR